MRRAQPEEFSSASSSTNPWPIPLEWKWLTVAGVGEVSLGRQRSPKDHSGPQMRRYVRAANITWRGLSLTDVKEMNFDDKEFARFQLHAGDVLLNEGSGSAQEVGKPAIWQDEIADCCFQNTLLRVRPTACSSEFLYHYFRFCALTEQFVSSTQGVNIYHIGKMVWPGSQFRCRQNRNRIKLFALSKKRSLGLTASSPKRPAAAS